MKTRAPLVGLVALSALMVGLIGAAYASIEAAGTRMEHLFSTGGAVTEEANLEILRLQNAMNVSGEVVGPLVFAAAVPLIALVAILVSRRSQVAGSASATASREASSD